MSRRSPWGSTRRLPSGRFQARYRVDDVEHLAPSTFATKRDAEAFLAGVRTDLERGTWVDVDAGKIAFAEYSTRWGKRRRWPERIRSRCHRRYAMSMVTVEERLSGALLRSARTQRGLSQTAFADLLGIAQPTLSAYESGRRQPTVPTLLRLLERAGLELRMELAERDDHDQVLAEWERTLTSAERDRLRAGGYRLTSDAG